MWVKPMWALVLAVFLVEVAQAQEGEGGGAARARTLPLRPTRASSSRRRIRSWWCAPRACLMRGRGIGDLDRCQVTWIGAWHAYWLIRSSRLHRSIFRQALVALVSGLTDRKDCCASLS